MTGQDPTNCALDIDTLRASVARLENKLVDIRRLFEEAEISTATFVNADAQLSSQLESARQVLAQALVEPLPYDGREGAG